MFISLKNLSSEWLLVLLPIQTTWVWSRFIFSPDIFANVCNVHMACINDSSLPSKKPTTKKKEEEEEKSCIIHNLGQKYGLFIQKAFNVLVVVNHWRQNFCSNEVQIRRTQIALPHHHHHQFLNHKGRRGTEEDFTTSFLHFSLFSIALWDLANFSVSITWCCLPISSSVCLFFFLPPPPSLCLARWFWPEMMNRRHVHTTAICISLQWSRGLHVVWLPAGSWHRLPRW